MNNHNVKNRAENKEKNKNQQKKTKKENKKPDDNWDEIENMLESFKEKDKNNCHLFNCGSSLGIKECVFCNMIFCIEHIRQPIHDCNYLKNMPNVNSEFYKNRINQKIENLEKERNAKPKKKKK
jgi:predicted nucleic acid binding AN1-type Zn finger protein